ncbi:hypothetical protein ACJJTC_000604 [Scirpophaga incertulas]
MEQVNKPLKSLYDDPYEVLKSHLILILPFFSNLEATLSRRGSCNKKNFNRGDNENTTTIFACLTFVCVTNAAQTSGSSNNMNRPWTQDEDIVIGMLGTYGTAQQQAVNNEIMNDNYMRAVLRDVAL